MNGTSGISTNMAQATFAPWDMSVRDSRSIQMRTTARGWMKQRRSSMTFFMCRIYSGHGLAWSLRRTGSADAHRRAELAGPEPGPARQADAARALAAARGPRPGRCRDRDGRAPGRAAGPGAVPAVLRAVVPAGRVPARRPGRVAGWPAGGPDRPDALHDPPRLRPRLPGVPPADPAGARPFPARHLRQAVRGPGRRCPGRGGPGPRGRRAEDVWRTRRAALPGLARPPPERAGPGCPGAGAADPGAAARRLGRFGAVQAHLGAGMAGRPAGSEPVG